MDKATQDALFEARDGYEDECRRHRFLLDAYAGTGGFSGRVRAETASWWGWAADAYSVGFAGSSSYSTTEDGITTYLDRFPREDLAKFKRRCDVVHYENHVQPCVDIPMSYLRRKPFTRDGVEALSEWMMNADGAANSWDSLVMGQIVLRGVVTGSVPVLLDLPAPATSGRMRTRADDIVEGRSVRAIPLFGAHVLDYGADEDGSAFRWVKLRFDYVDRSGPLAPKVYRTEIRVIDEETMRVFHFERSESSGEPSFRRMEESPNPFGAVPLVVFRPRPVDGDPYLGVSSILSIAGENRRLFNLHSELDEHIRSCVFAFLQVPVKDPKRAAEISAGSDSALVIDPDSRQSYAWIAPGPEVSSTLETRIENTVSSIYRMARLEFARGTPVTSAASGVSRAYEFEATNRSICDTALWLARFDETVLRVVSRAMPSPPPESEIRTTPADSYDIEDLDRELGTLAAMGRDRFGPTATAEARKRLVRKLVPNLTDKALVVIDREIEDESKSEATARKQADAASGDPLGAAFGG